METIDVTRTEAGLVTVTLDRPEKRNAINVAMWDELEATFHEISRSRTDRVVVVTGAGGAFCSGQDLSAVGTGSMYYTMRRIGEIALSLHRLPQPTIAKVVGVAAGAGLNLALGCDLIVAADDARFSEVFSRRGLSIDFGGSWLLPRLIGLHRAKELAFFAEIIDAAEAKELGLVNRVVPREEIDAFVDDWAAKLLAGPPIALAQTKELLNFAFERTLEQAVDAEGVAQSANSCTADTGEAIQAFLQKRAPRFEGR